MLRRLSVLIACALAACATTPPGSAPTHAPSTTETKALPELELVALDGQATSLKHSLAGRPTLVSLWATWCETCLTELDALGRLSQQAAERGAYVLAVSEGESRDTVAAFVKARGLAYPQLVDEKFQLADALGQRSVPATLVVDRKGQVVFRGAALDEAALKALDRALAP